MTITEQSHPVVAALQNNWLADSLLTYVCVSTLGCMCVQACAVCHAWGGPMCKGLSLILYPYIRFISKHRQASLYSSLIFTISLSLHMNVVWQLKCTPSPFLALSSSTLNMTV